MNTSAPAQNMYVAYPQTDGQTVGSNYVMKVWFSSSLDCERHGGLHQ